MAVKKHNSGQLADHTASQAGGGVETLPLPPHSAWALAQLCFILHRSFFVVVVVVSMAPYRSRQDYTLLAVPGGVYLQSR